MKLKKLKTYKIFADREKSVLELNNLIDNIHDYTIEIADDGLNVTSKIVSDGIRVHITNNMNAYKYESFRFQKYLEIFNSIIEYTHNEGYSTKITLAGCKKYGGSSSKSIDILGDDFIKIANKEKELYEPGLGLIDLDLVFVDSIFINIKND